MKILVLHNIQWAHYKSLLFEAIHKKKPADWDFKVIHVTKTERSRKGMKANDKMYEYPQEVLFNTNFEDISLAKKIKAITKVIWTNKPDVINIHGWGVDLSFTYATFLSFLLGIKVVISNESTTVEASQSKIKNYIKRFIVKHCVGFFSFGTSSTEYLFELGAKKEQILADKTAVVDNEYLKTVYLEEKSNPSFSVSTSKNFIYIGRIIHRKNIPAALEAFLSIKEKHPKLSKDWGFIVLGSGTKESLIKEYLVGKKDIYLFPGVSWYEVPKYLAKSKVLILNSMFEAWGLVVNEAMVCEQAVIVSKNCGCAKDLVKDNGFIVDPHDFTLLKKTMLHCIQNPEELAEFQKKSTTIIEEFSSEKISTKIVSGFKSLES